LRKHDPEIDQIIDTASSVAHYKFLSSSGVWDKTEVEGSLFLYSRHTSPVIVIFIMNRLNKKNTKLVLTHDMEFKIQKPFLLCKSASSEIIGIWFYDPDECQRFGTLLGRLSVLAKDERSLKIAAMMECQKKSNNSTATTDSSSNKNVILDMFNKAQNEYKNNGKHHQKKNPVDGNKSQSNVQNQQNKTKGNKVNKNKPDLYKRRSEPNFPSNPVFGKTVSDIESPTAARKNATAKQQDSFKKNHKKEQDMLLNILHGGETRKPSRTRTVSSSSDLESDIQPTVKNTEFSSKAGDLAIFNKLGIISENNQVVKEKAIGCAELESELIHRNYSDNNLKRMNRSISYDDAALRLVKSSPDICSIEHALLAATSLPDVAQPPPVVSSQNVTLLSPSLIKSKSISGKGRGTVLTSLMGNQKISIAAKFTASSNLTPKKLFPDNPIREKVHSEVAPSSTVANSLMSPAAFQRSMSKTQQEVSNNAHFILSKEQFQEALVHLIKNNEGFITSLHEAYVEASSKN